MTTNCGTRVNAPLVAVQPTAEDDDASPYKRITADFRGAIACGALRPGDPLPPLVDIAKRYDVAESTAHRAIKQLREAGLVEVSRGRRAVVAVPR